MVNSLLARAPSSARIRRRQRRPRPVLELEALEDRYLLATFNVFDQASLAATIQTANTNGQADTIRLANSIALTAVLPDFTDDGGNSVTVDGKGATLSRTGNSQFRVLHNFGANLSISDLTIVDGLTDGSGAGIFNQIGTLAVDHCTFSHNVTTGTTANDLFGLGGGLYNFPGAVLSLADCTFDNNQAQQLGGGIRNQGIVTSIIRCTFTNNTGVMGGGGAICNFIGGTIDLLSACTFTGNHAARGGGICNHGTVTVLDSTFANNSADLSGGAIQCFGTIPLLANCTFTANSTPQTGGAIETAPFSIGMFSEVGTITSLTNCTIVGNSAANTGVGQVGGGGIQNNTIIVQLSSTIIAQNQAGQSSQNGNVVDFTGNNPSQSWANFIGGDPQLGPLQNNGGLTQTMALLPGSPARGTGINPNGLLTDQRGFGFARSVGGVVDAGAFEVQASSVIVAAVGLSGAPEVKVFDAATHAVKLDFLAYASGFTGGVRVAVGDVTGDGVPDIVTAPGPGGGPDIHVYDGSTGQLVRQFFAYDPNFTGGVYVAAGDVNGDGFADIICGADAGGGPNVAVFSGMDGTRLMSFFAYDPNFTGGVRVAAGDVNRDAMADIVCGAGPGGGPNVTVFSGVDGSMLASFLACDPNFITGIYVAAGHVNNDSTAEIITGAGAGGGPNITVFSLKGNNASVLVSFFAYDPAFTGGVRVGAVNSNRHGEVLATLGAGGGPDVGTFDGLTGSAVDHFFAFNPAFTGGLYVAGSGL